MAGKKCRSLKVSKNDKIEIAPFDYHTSFIIKKGKKWCNVDSLFKKEIVTSGTYKDNALLSDLKKKVYRGSWIVRLKNIPKKYLR